MQDWMNPNGLGRNAPSAFGVPKERRSTLGRRSPYPDAP